MRDILELPEIYDTIMGVLKRYMDMDERYYHIVTLWIIGTYFHKDFRTYPYLFLHASKGSGKTRLLKLITYFSKNGKLIGLPSEAFVFRSAETCTFCMDEMETIDTKEKRDLKLLLNSAYKKGLFIPRMKKEKEGEMVTEEFEAYAPICIANIWGMGDVTMDRCIKIILEKSDNPKKTKKIEAWDREKDAVRAKNALQKLDPREVGMRAFFTYISSSMNKKRVVSVVSDEKTSIFNILETTWNDILDNIDYNIITQITHTTLTTLTQHTKNTTNTTQTTQNKEKSSYNNILGVFERAFTSLDWTSGKYGIEPTTEFFNFLKEIYMSGIEGRDLELYFPLFIVSGIVSEDLYNKIVQCARADIEQKRMDDTIVNADAQVTMCLLYFIRENDVEKFYTMNELIKYMVEMIGDEEERRDGSTKMIAPKWLNSRFLGRALIRMNFTKSKKRTNRGVKVCLNEEKIKGRARVLGIEYEPEEQRTLEDVAPKADVEETLEEESQSYQDFKDAVRGEKNE